MKKIVVIIIRNSNLNFFVHQRKNDKKTFPNLFGLGAGGHIELNETKEEAAIRELFEETGLKTIPKFIFEFTYKDNNEKYPLSVFELVTDNYIIPSENEWQWSGWLSLEEVNKLSEDNKLCPDTNIFYKKYCAEFICIEKDIK